MKTINTRETVNEWIEIAERILKNPREKIINKRLNEVVDYQIISYALHDKIELKMKCNSMNNYYTVTVAMQESDPE